MEGRRKVPVLSVRAGASGALEVPVVGAMQKIRRREVQKVRGWQRPKIASVGWRCRWPGWVSTAKKSRIKRMAWVACPWGIQCLGLSTRGGWCSCGARHISILRCVRCCYRDFRCPTCSRGQLQSSQPACTHRHLKTSTGSVGLRKRRNV